MPKLQIGPDGRLKVKGRKVLLARTSPTQDPCCCGEDGGGPLYARVADCCNRERVLWVLLTKIGGCSTIQRLSPGGTLECWSLDTAQEPLTAAQIALAYPDEAIDAPGTLDPYPCGACGVAPCPACPECCMRLDVPVDCDTVACCNVGRRFRLRYDLLVTQTFRSIPTLFFSPDCGGLIGNAQMYVDDAITFHAVGSFVVDRARNGATCDGPVVECAGNSFIRRTRRREEPGGPTTLEGCTLIVPPRTVTIDEDFTEQACWGSPFDVSWFWFRPTGGNYFDTYGPAIANEECTANPEGGIWPLSGSWTGSTSRDDSTASASYARTIARTCASLVKNEDYDEVFTYRQLPGLPFTANIVQRSSVTIEVIDPECGTDPCGPGPGGGGGGSGLGGAGGLGGLGGLLRGVGGTVRPAVAAVAALGRRDGLGAIVGGCGGCGDNAGVRAATAGEMAIALRAVRG